MALRPDLNGLRFQEPGQVAIYLIDGEGQKRHIPDPPTYDALFRTWEGVQQNVPLSEVDLGVTITPGAVLAMGKARPEVYLIDHGQKRHVVNPASMDKYHFRWPTTEIDQIILDSIPSGNPII